MNAHRNKTKWNPREEELLRAYAKMDDGFERLARRLGRSVKAIQLKADDLGIERSKKSVSSGFTDMELETVKDKIVEDWENSMPEKLKKEGKKKGYIL